MIDFDYQSLYQTLLVTINMIENALLRKYKWLPYNNFIYKYRVLKNKNQPDLNDLRLVLQEKANSSLSDIITYENTIKLMSDEYNVYVYNSFLQEEDKEFRVYWNGALQFGYEILTDISKGVIYLNDLMIYQHFIIKWFVTKILLGFKHFLILIQQLLNSNSNHIEYKKKMIINLDEFEKLELPFSLDSMLFETVQNIIDTLYPESTDLDYVSLQHSVQLIDKNIESLDVFSTNDVKRLSINDIITSVSTNITQCSTFLEKLSKKTQNIFISLEISLSPIENEITYKDFITDEDDEEDVENLNYEEDSQSDEL